MIARTVTRSNLKDVSDTSSIKQMLAAAAREDDEAYFQMENILTLFSIDSATGDDLDARAKEIQPPVVTRKGPRKSTGQVVFSRPGTVGTLNIPAGTRVKTEDQIVFLTTAATSITPTSPEQISGHGVGRDSPPVNVQAEIAGIAGDVIADSIIRFDVKPTGVNEVTNPNPTLFGRDKESDDVFRQRLKDYIAALARSTVQALEAAVLNLEDPDTGREILFSSGVESLVTLGHGALYIDDGTGSVESTAVITNENVTAGLSGPPPDSAVGGEERLFLDEKPVKESEPFTLSSSTRGALTQGTDYTLNSASGQLNFTPVLVTGEVITANYTHYTGLIQLAQKVIDGDKTDRENFPGIRAGGTLWRVKTPVVLIQTVIAILTVREGFTAAVVVAEAVDAVKSYINGLGISGDVIRNEVISRIQSLPGVFNVVLSAPAADITLLDDELARITDANISIT
jgi:uncharacterized phage protein gp47/JayE